MSTEIVEPTFLEGVVGSWIYTFLILPIIFVALKTYKLESRTAVNETKLESIDKVKATKEEMGKVAANQIFNVQTLEKLCQTQTKLGEDINNLTVNFTAVATKIDTFIDLHEK